MAILLDFSMQPPQNSQQWILYTPSTAKSRCKNTWHTVPYLVLYDLSMILWFHLPIPSPPLPSPPLPLKIQCACSLTLESSFSFSRDSSDRDTLGTWDFDFRPIKTKHNIIMWHKCFREALKTGFRLSAEWMLRAWQKLLISTNQKWLVGKQMPALAMFSRRFIHCIVFVSVDCRLV